MNDAVEIQNFSQSEIQKGYLMQKKKKTPHIFLHFSNIWKVIY